MVTLLIVISKYTYMLIGLSVHYWMIEISSILGGKIKSHEAVMAMHFMLTMKIISKYIHFFFPVKEATQGKNTHKKILLNWQCSCKKSRVARRGSPFWLENCLDTPILKGFKSSIHQLVMITVIKIVLVVVVMMMCIWLTEWALPSFIVAVLANKQFCIPYIFKIMAAYLL